MGLPPQRRIIAEPSGDELGRRRVDRVVADQALAFVIRSTCSSSEVRRSRFAVDSASAAGSPGSPSSRSSSISQGRRSKVMRSEHPPRPVVEHAVPDRVEEQVVAQLLRDLGQQPSRRSRSTRASGRQRKARRVESRLAPSSPPSRPAHARPGHWRTRRPGGGRPAGSPAGPATRPTAVAGRETTPSTGTRPPTVAVRPGSAPGGNRRCDSGSSRPR